MRRDPLLSDIDRLREQSIPLTPHPNFDYMLPNELGLPAYGEHGEPDFLDPDSDMGMGGD